ncbi:DUF2313 domain-containing protein [Leuconostoc carnosum]|uniref:putative phage tail protein n=1 Tax=Leuconostoc TaxID=1243 RepID=UPI00123A9E85|nr:putative phage tail protein [Leuconostoc carnosum]KAA8371095.1 DUF2313 domain-containing protein [Leuconostoc carnosum]KAA8382736.1 DUF2313 domain-containing protein [Leuconostoc carnosum]
MGDNRLQRLKDFLPDYYENIYDMQMLVQAEQYQLDDLQNAFEKSQNNMFVLTADEDAIGVFEDIYDISSDGLSLETRRYNVLTAMLPPEPVTLSYINQLIKRLNINARIESVSKDYHVNLQMFAVDGESSNRLDQLLQRFLPANLTYTKILNETSNLSTDVNVGVAHATSVDIGGK